MVEYSNRQKMFEGMLSSQSFDLLKDFQDSQSWEALQPEEKEILAQLFLLRAEAEKNEKAEASHEAASATSYRCACLLTPTSARGWYRLGVFLATCDRIESLREAYTVLKKAACIDGRFFDAQYALASVCLRLFVSTKEESFCLEAEHCFYQASELVAQLHPRFFWHWGIARFLLARNSGEPSDFKASFTLYEKALSMGFESGDFFSDMATVCAELGILLSDEMHVRQGISFLEKGIELSDTLSDVEKAQKYFHLGSYYQYLFDNDREKESFEKAKQAFAKAVFLDKNFGEAYQRQAHLLYKAAKLFDNRLFFEEVIDQCKKVEECCKAISPVTMALGALSLLHLSSASDHVEVFGLAYDMAKEAERLSQGESSPEVHAALVLSLIELGTYFSDDSFFEKAEEELRKGLKKHEENPLLWHLLGVLRMIKAQIFQDEALVKDALIAFFIASKSSYAYIPSFWNDVACAFSMLGDLTDSKEMLIEALVSFERAKNLSCEITPMWICKLALTYELLGSILEEESFFLQSIELLEGVCAILPSHLEARLQMAGVYLQYAQLTDDPEKYEHTLSLLRSYCEQESEDGFAYAEYACALVHLGYLHRVDEQIPREWFLAEEALIQAIYLGYDIADYHLASLYSAMGDRSQAFFHLYEALKKQALPSFSEIEENEMLSSLFSTQLFAQFKKEALSSEQEEETIQK